MSFAFADPGSFRDPGGQVFVQDGRVFRTVNATAVADYNFVERSGLIGTLVENGWLVDSQQVNPNLLPDSRAEILLEHPLIPLISYPYEWPFAALKEAALLHIDIHLLALQHGVTLSDASAYNIQFVGTKPVFIDRLSFVQYNEGDLWSGHRQFCEQFLNPLLLRAYCGIAHNAWYRGTLEGIPVADLTRLLPVRRKLSIGAFVHLVMQSGLQRGAPRVISGMRKAPTLPKPGLEMMLRGLRKWIAGLQPKDVRTVWADYAQDNSYLREEAAAKRAFVTEFVRASGARQVWDFGCNSGDYLIAALDGGASYGVGLDFDQEALDRAFVRAKERGLPLQFLFFDASNPSPDQGWAERERMSLSRRGTADALLALAFVHHLAIAKNVPLERVLRWLISHAPQGVVEFVPKTDPMVQEMLRNRKDIFPGYTLDAFRQCLAAEATIVAERQVSRSGRHLIWFDRSKR